MSRILVVDDEAALREVEALHLLDHHRYDLILSDLRMPELDGPHLYEALHHRCHSVLPAVVFMTGHVGDWVDEVLQPGALVLEKPFTLTALRELVDRLLATRSGRTRGGPSR